MRKVVAGWNGTDEGHDALRLAAQLASRLRAHLVVACVIDPGALPELSRHRDEWVARFNELFEEARAELGAVEFSVREIVEGAPEGLREIAEEEGADVLVLGQTHRGRIGRILPGSVAERIFEEAPCAVAVAPRGYAREQGPGLGVIGVGYDGSHESRAALRLAADLAELGDEEVRVVTIGADYGEADIGPLEVLREENERRLARGLEQLPGDLPRSGVVMVGGNAAALLEDQGVELDLLVIGSRGRGPLKDRLLGSVSADVVRKAPCPVLVLPHGVKPPVLPGRDGG